MFRFLIRVTQGEPVYHCLTTNDKLGRLSTMLKSSTYETVIRFDLARTFAGRGRYWTTAYLLDGLLIDSGCAFTARELVKALEDATLTRIVNTHTHEDHIAVL